MGPWGKGVGKGRLGRDILCSHAESEGACDGMEVHLDRRAIGCHTKLEIVIQVIRQLKEITISKHATW